MSRFQTVTYDLSDCRSAHLRIYDLELHDGDAWVPHGRLAVMRDAITHDGDHVHTIEYHGANHALLLWGKVGDPTFQARLNLTDCGTALVGTLSTGGGAPRAVRGVGLEQVYHTERRLTDDPYAPFDRWEDFTIRSEWVDGQLKITYLLGADDVSDRVRVTHVDRPKGETTLEMVPEFVPPFRQGAFSIVLASGAHSFGGTLTDEEENVYIWRGGTAPSLAETRAAVFRAAHESRAALLAMAAPASTMTLQDLDNISSIQVLIDTDGNQTTVDFAQTTCGKYFNQCLANALEQEWIDGIYGHAFALPEGVRTVFTTSNQLFKDNAVLGTGQMLHDTQATNPRYADLIRRIDEPAMKAAWENMGQSPTTGVAYQEASNALYIQGYRDSVAQMRPYLDDNPEKWAEDYFHWLSDSANLLTWQIQIASKQFDNVKTRMYEWYVKLQVLAPDRDYGERLMTIAYAALLGVNYSRSQWADNLKPFLHAVIEQAMSGKVDKEVMDQLQQQEAEENQKILRTLITTQDDIASLVDGISAALTSYQLGKSLQQLALDSTAQARIGQELTGAQSQAWGELTVKGKAGGMLSMLFYGATAGFLIYTVADNSKKPLKPRDIIEEVNMGVLAMAILVKGIEKMMSLGVGRFLESFSRVGGGGAFATFAGDIATWFKVGGKIVPEGKVGRAFVAIFGENSAEFMARRIGPAMALVGVVLSAAMLLDAIRAGTVRDIVFEALNAFFALADLAFIGLNMANVGWAGPVGLAVAAIGIIVVLVQLIWGLIDPPPPPPDPVRNFVDGPMVTKGFAHST